MRKTKVTLVPIVVAAAAFFLVLSRSGGDATIEMIQEDEAFSFSPARLELAAGSRVLVVNRTQATHTLTAVTEAFDVEIQPGDSRFLDAPGDGTFDFYCRYHATSDSMTGTLVLGEPSAGVTPAPTSTP
jgi:plastocyanin